MVFEPFQRLIAEDRVGRYKYSGFWQCMDTFRDKQILDELEASGDAPWRLWRNGHPIQSQRPQSHAKAGTSARSRLQR